MKACPVQVLHLVISADSNTPRCSSLTPDTSSLQTSNLLWTRTSTTSVLNMISVYAWSALVWIFLSVQAPAQGGLTKLVEVSRIDLGTKYKLSVTYEADSPVDAVWTTHGQIVVPGSQEGPGKVSLETEKNSDFLPSLDLGDRKSHYLEIYWSNDGNGTRTSRLDLPLSSVSPGTDNVYNPNDHLNVTVEVQHGGGNGSLETDGEIRSSSVCYVNKTLQELECPESVPFATTSSYRENDVTTNTVMFHVDDVINGYFVYLAYVHPVNRSTSALKMMIEHIVLNVHEPGISGPFPNGFVSTDLWATNGRVYCISYGNDVESVNIYKNGSGEKMETIKFAAEFFKRVMVQLDTTLDITPGEYVCNATVADSDTKEDPVTESI